MPNDTEGRILTGTEANEEIARQFRELENKDNRKPIDFFAEESEGEKETNKFLEVKKSKVEFRTSKIKIRAHVNAAFFELMQAARYEDERLFAVCIACLKAYAIDPALKEKAGMAYNHIMKAFDQFKIDDNKLMDRIADIKYSWEKVVKLPWNITDELIAENILTLTAQEVKDKYFS